MPLYPDRFRMVLAALALVGPLGCGGEDAPPPAAPAASPMARAGDIRLLPPGAVTADVTARGEVELRWLDTNKTEDGYLLERRLPDAFAWAPAQNLPADTSSATDAEVLPSRTYFYRVVAHAGGVTNPSPSIRVTVRDLIPPSTEVIFRPPQITSARSAVIVFRADEGAATFECSLDGRTVPCQTGLECYADQDTCQGRFTAGGLEEGEHVFLVQAIDLAGNVDATPTSVSWFVDNTPPKITLGTRPADPTASSTAGFTFAVDETMATVTCQLNSAAPARCFNSFSADLGFASGTQTFRISAVDLIGNTSSVVYEWRRDTSPPAIAFRTFEGVSITATNALYVQSRPTVTVGFTATDEIAGSIVDLQCRLTTPAGTGAFATCPPPLATMNCGSACETTVNVPGAGDGTYSLEVSTVDQLGNRTWPIPPLHRLTWTFDDTPPAVSFIQQPDAATATSYLRWRYGSPEPITGFTCRFDGTPRACANPTDVPNVAIGGPYTFEVTAWDRAGNGGAISSSTTVGYPTWSQDPALAGGPFLQILSGDFGATGAQYRCFAKPPELPWIDGDCPDFTAWPAIHYDTFGGTYDGRVALRWQLDDTGDVRPLGPRSGGTPIESLPITRPDSGEAIPGPAHTGWTNGNASDHFRYEVHMTNDQVSPYQPLPYPSDRLDFSWQGIDHLLLRHAHPPRGQIVTPDAEWLVRVLADARAVDSPGQSSLRLRAVAPEGDVVGERTLAWSSLFYGSHVSAVVDLPLRPPYCSGWFEVQAAALPGFTTPAHAADNDESVIRVPVMASGSGDDPGEPNDAQGQETVLGTAPLSETNRVFGDEDWYRVTIPSTDDWTVRAEVPGGYGQNIAIDVHAAGNPVALDSAAGTNAAQRTLTALPAGDYDIRVFTGGAYPACRRYRLSVSN
jgi:hypothetical protein